MEKKIKSIENGYGEGSTYFSTEERVKNTRHYVDEIKCIEKVIGKGYTSNEKK